MNPFAWWLLKWILKLNLRVCLIRFTDSNLSSAGPSSLCFVWPLGLIVPNFRSLCHSPLTRNWSDIMITNSRTKCQKLTTDCLWFLCLIQSRYISFTKCKFVCDFFFLLKPDIHTSIENAFLMFCKQTETDPTWGWHMFFLLYLSRSEAAVVWMYSVYETTDWQGYHQSCHTPRSCMFLISLETGMFRILKIILISVYTLVFLWLILFCTKLRLQKASEQCLLNWVIHKTFTSLSDKSFLSPTSVQCSEVYVFCK